jgi:hypothetical protein
LTLPLRERASVHFPNDVTAATQYGANIAAVAVYLQHWHFVPEDRLAELMQDIFGIALTTATIAAMAQGKAEQWSNLAGHIGDLKMDGVAHALCNAHH